MSKKYLTVALISLAVLLLAVICILVSTFAFKEEEQLVVTCSSDIITKNCIYVHIPFLIIKLSKNHLHK